MEESNEFSDQNFAEENYAERKLSSLLGVVG
jgi:hypothetical protein